MIKYGTEDAGALIRGILLDERLSANIPRIGGTNAFTGANSFSMLLNLLVGQIQFPSTQNSSSNANTLDDYEEGNWVPIIGGGSGETGQTYSNQEGYYIKVGRLVFAWFDVTLTNKGTITGSIQLKGLPFVVGNGIPGAPFGQWTSFNTAISSLAGLTVPGTTLAVLYAAIGAVVSNAQLATADITNATRLTGGIPYGAAA